MDFSTPVRISYPSDQVYFLVSSFLCVIDLANKGVSCSFHILMSIIYSLACVATRHLKKNKPKKNKRANTPQHQGQVEY